MSGLGFRFFKPRSENLHLTHAKVQTLRSSRLAAVPERRTAFQPRLVANLSGMWVSQTWMPTWQDSLYGPKKRSPSRGPLLHGNPQSLRVPSWTHRIGCGWKSLLSANLFLNSRTLPSPKVWVPPIFLGAHSWTSLPSHAPHRLLPTLSLSPKHPMLKPWRHSQGLKALTGRSSAEPLNLQVPRLGLIRYWHVEALKAGPPAAAREQARSPSPLLPGKNCGICGRWE